MAAVWKETHRGTIYGKNYGNALDSISIIAGIVKGLDDTSDQLEVAEQTALAAYPSGHPDSGLGIIESQAKWLRGNTGDTDMGIAEVVITFGVGKAGGVTGGTVAGNEVIAGMYAVQTENTFQAKGPGDTDQQTTYGIGRQAKFLVLARNSPAAVPNINKGGKSTVTLHFGVGGTAPTLGPVDCVITECKTAGVGLLQYEGEIRTPA